MTRALHRLSNLKVARVKQPGMYADGGSLYLRVAPGGSKQWVFRYVANGRLRDMGIGPVHTLTLAEARERATEARKLRLDGLDPISDKRKRRAAAMAEAAGSKTFKECAEGFLHDKRSSWTNVKHARQWEASLAKYVYSALGALPVSDINTPLILSVIKPLWSRIPETADRVRGRIENVLDWATVHHYRAGDNPARWSGLLEHALPAPTKGAHHAALPYAELPAFIAKLREANNTAAPALRFLILTAGRTGEVLGAKWDEIDLKTRIWTIPAARMKAGKEHRVPLSDAALAVLEAMCAIRQSDYVFAGTQPGRPLAEDGLIWLAKKLHGNGGVTAHGFRSSFRDWASEHTSFPREVCEMALAHAIPSAVEAAYRRGDLFAKRGALMQAWADYCGGKIAGENVVAIGRRP
jgi:integrase